MLRFLNAFGATLKPGLSRFLGGHAPFYPLKSLFVCLHRTLGCEWGLASRLPTWVCRSLDGFSSQSCRPSWDAQSANQGSSPSASRASEQRRFPERVAGGSPQNRGRDQGRTNVSRSSSGIPGTRPVPCQEAS